MDVKARIRNYFATVIPEPVGDEDDIFERGVVNSLFAMQLVMFVEREFSIVAERQDLDIRNFCSIAALVAFVEAKLSLAAST
jgi:methoxymalonate biosynthesis acyl carrier protein